MTNDETDAYAGALGGVVAPKGDNASRQMVALLEHAWDNNLCCHQTRIFCELERHGGLGSNRERNGGSHARVSFAGQSLDVQIEALITAGCEMDYAEKRERRTAANRIELPRALDRLRSGDQLIVTRLYLLTQSIGDCDRLVKQIDKTGVTVR